MKLIALLCFVGLAAAAPRISWEDGKEYHFTYQGRLLTGIPQLNRQTYSGVGMKCNLKVQVRQEGGESLMAITVEDFKVSENNGKLQKDPKNPLEQVNWRNVKLQEFHSVPSEIAQQVQRTFVARIGSNGEFQQMNLRGDEPEWSVNFKKALVALFQVRQGSNQIEGSGSSELNFWKTQEEGLDGICEVFYQLNEMPQHGSTNPEYARQEARSSHFACQQGEKKYELVKTRNVNSCKKRDSFSYYKPGFFRCNAGDCEGMWSRTAVTKYEVCGSQSGQDLKIMSVLNDGELEQNLFGQKSETYVTGTKQDLKLVNKVNSGGQFPSSSGGSLVISDLEYLYAKASQNELIVDEPTILGHMGSALKSGDEQQIAQQIKQLMQEVLSDMFNAQQASEKLISAKVLSMSRGFHLLKKQTIQSLYQELKQSCSGPEKLYSMKNIFFDCVVMGGSTENIRFIKDMILNGGGQQQQEMSTTQMSSVLTMLPNYILRPNHEILNELYELVTSQVVKSNHIVYNQAVMGYTTLIQKVCIAQNRKSSYPTWVFNEFCSPQSPVVTEKWIPYLEHQLQQEGSSTEQKNFMIVNLGLLGHKSVVPILSRVIDNLSFDRQSQTTRMSRFLAIYGLGRVGQRFPQLVSPIAYTILRNQYEPTEHRIAALNVLLRLNPENNMLHSIGALTWYEKNNEVLKAINTAFFSLANQESNRVVNNGVNSLQRKAQLIYPLIKKTEQISSASIWYGQEMPDLQTSYSKFFSWTTSNHNSMPNNAFSKSVYLLDRYQFTPYVSLFKLDGGDNLIQQIIETIIPGSSETKEDFGRKVYEKLSGEWKQVIDRLQIRPRDNSQQSQGAMFIRAVETTPVFHSFMAQSSQMLKQKLRSFSNVSPFDICGEHHFNMQRALNLAPTVDLIPSDMGLPILIDVHMPTVVSLRGKVNVECMSRKISMDIKPFAAGQYSGYVGTINPSNQKKLYTVVDNEDVISLGKNRISATVTPTNHQVTLSATPLGEITSKTNLIHFKVRPYTVSQDHLDIKPFTQNQQSKTIQSRGYPAQSYPLVLSEEFTAKFISESQFLDYASIVERLQWYRYCPITFTKFIFFSNAQTEQNTPSLRYHLYNLEFTPQSSSQTTYSVTIKLGVARKTKSESLPQYYFLEQGSTGQPSYPNWDKVYPVRMVAKPLGQDNDKQTYRQRLIKEILEKIQIENGGALSLIISPSAQGSRVSQQSYAIKIAYGIEGRQAKWSAELTQGESNKILCINGEVSQTTRYPPVWSIEGLRSSQLSYRVQNTVGWNGGNCQASKIVMRGQGEVSQKQKDYSRVSNAAQEYRKLKENGAPMVELSAPARKVRQQASTVDNMHFTIDYQNVSPKIQRDRDFIVSSLKYAWFPNTFVGLPNYGPQPQSGSWSQQQGGQTSFQDTLDLKFCPKSYSVNVTIVKSQQDGQGGEEEAKFNHVRVPTLLRYFFPLNFMGAQQPDSAINTVVYKQCSLEKDTLQTYEGAMKPEKMDDCFHLLSADCSAHKTYAILLRSMEANRPDGPKEMKILVDEKHSIKLTPSGGDSLKLKIDGQEKQLQRSSGLSIKNQRDLIIVNIKKDSAGVIEISTAASSGVYNLVVRFDGYKAQVFSSKKYNGRTCGLCGDQTGNRASELSGPKKCLYSKPELQTASYRVSTEGHQCRPLPQEVQQQLRQEQQQCVQPNIYPSGKISQSLEGLAGECTKHAHEIRERSSELCFSRRPVTQCSELCRPEPRQETEKQVSFTCMPKDRVAEHFKEQILAGRIIPGLADYPESFSIKQHLPRSCVPRRSY